MTPIDPLDPPPRRSQPSPPELWAELATGRRALTGVLIQLLEDGQDRARYRDGIAPREFVVDRVLDPIELEAREMEPTATARMLSTLLTRGLLHAP